MIGGMVSQNVLNLVDTAMVGSLGTDALAAVGLGGFANFMAIAALTSLSAGVQAVAARRFGEGRLGETAHALNAALLLAVVIGVPLMVVVEIANPWVFPLLNPDPNVAALGVPYLTARLAAVPAVAANFAFRGYWNGTNRPGLYFRTLVIAHTINIALNALLIFGLFGFPRLGATGAGVASMVSTYAGTLIYFGLARQHATRNGFLASAPDRATMKSVLQLSVPNGVQQLLFSTGLVVLMWILGQLGTNETAAGTALINVMLVAILPALALGMVATSLVGQSLGRGDPIDAKVWGWEVVGVACGVSLSVAVPMAVFAEPVLAVFLREPDALAIATTPLRIFAAGVTLDCAGPVLSMALIGAGASRVSMNVAVGTQWLLFLPAAFVAGPVLGCGLSGIWAAQTVYRLIQAGILAAIWKRARWFEISV